MGGASSKQTFTKLVQALLEKEIKPDDHEFWDELWRTVLTPQEVFEIISPDDVRKLITDRPSHVKTLFTQAVAQLYQLVETPYPVYFEQALNCMRILARVLPLLLESDEKYVWELLWNKRMVKNQATMPSSEEGKGEEGVGADSSLDVTSASIGDIQESEPLAVILINTIFHLMFLPDLTVEDPGEDFNENDVNSPAFKAALMWAPGVGKCMEMRYGYEYMSMGKCMLVRIMILVHVNVLCLYDCLVFAIKKTITILPFRLIREDHHPVHAV